MNALKGIGAKAQGAVDSATGKTKLQDELDAEKAAHADCQADLAECQRELLNYKSALEAANLNYSKARQHAAELQATLDNIKAEENAKNVAAERSAAEAKAAADALASASADAKNKALTDAAACYEAMSGITTNDKKLISAIAPNNNAQLQVLKETFLTSYGKKLEDRVRTHQSGNNRTFLLGLMKTVPTYLCDLIDEAIGTVSTDTDLVAEVVAPLSPAEVAELKATWDTQGHKHNLLDKVAKGTSGDISEYLTIILTGNRDADGPVNDTKVQADAVALHAAGQGRTIGVDRMPFFTIVGTRSPAHLAALNEAYKTTNKKGIDLVACLEKQFGGTLANALVSTLLANINTPAYYAWRAERAMAGIGCDENMLIRVLVARRDKDRDAIKAAYHKMYNADLGDRIKSELGGHTRQIALESWGFAA